MLFCKAKSRVDFARVVLAFCPQDFLFFVYSSEIERKFCIAGLNRRPGHTTVCLFCYDFSSLRDLVSSLFSNL